MEDLLLPIEEKEEQVALMTASNQEKTGTVPPLMPTGCENFQKLRENNCYYIDKTGILQRLLKMYFDVALFTRPRRFGKTLTMSTLEYFLSIEKKEIAPSLFDGLEIMKDKEVCDNWMNKYPVISITLKDIEADTFQEAYIQLVSIIAGIASNFAQKLRDSSRFERLPRDLADSLVILENGVAITPREGNISRSLKVLCEVAHFIYEKKVILLIDEYDVPLAKADKKGYYDKIISLIRGLFNTALKTNNYLERAILTGCLHISKESIFTGLNNLDVYDISNADFVDLFGFTPSEVQQLLKDTGFSSMENTIREWYDGYRFGAGYWQEIFCPWDVIKYIKDLSGNNGPIVKITPPFYWKNCSSNDIIFKIKDEGGKINASYVDDLLAEKCILVELDQQVTYKNLYSYIGNDNQANAKKRRNTLWTVLYMTGYLTLATPEKIAETGINLSDRETALVIPNREIRKLFKEIVEPWNESIQIVNRSELFEAFWEGSTKKATKILTHILENSVSFRETSKESFYQALLQGMAIGLKYEVTAEQESGDGYYDLAIENDNEECIIFEFKKAASGDPEDLEESLNEALTQMKERRYGKNFRGKKVLRYGIAFFKKKCLVGKLDDLTEAHLSSLS